METAAVIILLVLLFAGTARYIYVNDLRRRVEAERRTGLLKKTWRRDLTPHETKIYNEMQAHWRRESRKVYKRLAYDKTIKYTNGKP